MSISRKNWSALSSLTRQWTVEDEEEVERERRRKTRSFSSSTDPCDGPEENEPVSRAQDDPESEDSRDQVDFIELLKVRDERRRKRHVEVLRQQRDGEQLGEMEGAPRDRGSEGPKPRDRGSEGPKPRPDPPTSSNNTASGIQEKEGGRCVSDQQSNIQTPKKSSRMFVSSLSISFDKSPQSPTERGRLVSPLSPTGPFRAGSPEDCAQGSPSSKAPVAITQDGEAQRFVNGSPSDSAEGENSEERPFSRQSVKALSFRMARSKVDQGSPLQRSASVRIASRVTGSSQAPSQEEDKQSPFQRNSRQRISSRSIQEKMEQLALAAQKSESAKSHIATQKNLGRLVDEFSRKRELFERESVDGQNSPRQDYSCTTAGISERISRWVHKSPQVPSDLRNIDISSQRATWEGRNEDSSPRSRAYK